MAFCIVSPFLDYPIFDAFRQRPRFDQAERVGLPDDGVERDGPGILDFPDQSDVRRIRPCIGLDAQNLRYRIQFGNQRLELAAFGSAGQAQNAGFAPEVEPIESNGQFRDGDGVCGRDQGGFGCLVDAA